MGYRCFKFWLCYQAFITALQHFNFGYYIYTNCVYFTLWKAYDLLWLWTEFFLCFCFPMLRDYNYLFTFLNLLKKRALYPSQSLEFIYERETLIIQRGDPKETTCCSKERKRPRPDMKSVNRKRRSPRILNLDDENLNFQSHPEIYKLQPMPATETTQLQTVAKTNAESEEEEIVENRKEMADSIELVITLLRTLCSLALLLGNFQRIVYPAPAKYLGPDRPYYESTFSFVFFIITTLFDSLLFLISCMVTWGCDCITLWFRIGCGNFVSLLILWGFASLSMMLPMLMAMGEMDHSWCQFKNDSALSNWQPSWHRGL
ncbi:unnamed protein product, partial [Mesorhabditis belari]|uniref:Uncharacterized protein n=1 Tax=Mesorhabditis belari TaxID=2138241 RepID=A0AAF3FB70_9BILA